MLKRLGLLLIFTLTLTGSAFGFGMIDSAQTYARMELDPAKSLYIAYLIDTRTPEEWSGDPYTIGSTSGDTPGHPVVAGNAVHNERVFNVPWMLFDGTGKRQDNPDFEADLLGLGLDMSQPFALLCHSGTRSYKAAKALEASSSNEGWKIFNVVGGFEGRAYKADDYYDSPANTERYCPLLFYTGYTSNDECPGWMDYDLPPTENWQGAYNHVPIPGALWLLGSGLAACGALRRRFRK
ncbi:MAG: rhodanese-like domain-containing protein [Pseudomonadota bacterium]